MKNLHFKTNTFKRQCNSPELPPEPLLPAATDPANAEGPVVCLSDLHLLCHLRTGRHQRTPSENSLPFSWVRLAPGDGGARLPESASGRPRAPSLRFTLSPLLHPRSAKRVARVFRPLGRLCWRGQELQGLPALASSGIRVLPTPATLLGR